MLGGGLVMWLIHRHRRRARRALAAATRLAIAAVPEGEKVKITGVVENRDPLITSPVGGHPCIGFTLVIERGATENRDFLVQRADCRPFLLSDETGTVAVDGPFRMELDVDDGAWANLPPSVYSLLEEELGQKKASVYFDSGQREIRFKEALLRPGDRVSVLGRSTVEIDPAGRGSYREAPMLAHIRGTEKEPVIIADAEEPAASEGRGVQRPA